MSYEEKREMARELVGRIDEVVRVLPIPERQLADLPDGCIYVSLDRRLGVFLRTDAFTKAMVGVFPDFAVVGGDSENWLVTGVDDVDRLADVLRTFWTGQLERVLAGDRSEDTPRAVAQRHLRWLDARRSSSSGPGMPVLLVTFADGAWARIVEEHLASLCVARGDAWVALKYAGQGSSAPISHLDALMRAKVPPGAELSISEAVLLYDDDPPDVVEHFERELRSLRADVERRWPQVRWLDHLDIGHATFVASVDDARSLVEFRDRRLRAVLEDVIAADT